MEIGGHPTEPITLDGKATQSGDGLACRHTNHRCGGDVFPRRERSAILIDGSHRNADASLDTKCLEGLRDHGPGVLAHVGPDPKRRVEKAAQCCETSMVGHLCFYVAYSDRTQYGFEGIRVSVKSAS
jgi:hypothetical protein